VQVLSLTGPLVPDATLLSDFIMPKPSTGVSRGLAAP
jgi:hypothetical protein